ncbi:MAG: transketolase [Anaerolineales bacterium]|nr:transketolase [Anaerolineales bacterium]
MGEAPSIAELKATCVDVRRDIVQMIHAGGSGHPGGSLSVVEILTALYFRVMRIDPRNPAWDGRDRLIVSKGHASSALYAVLARRGFFPVETLSTFNAPGTRLQKHIDMLRVPGVEVSSGSLGQGLSVGVGMALADRLDQRDRRVFVVLSDGECQAGQTGEAAMAAAHYGLGKLMALVDHNRLQTDGEIAEIMAIAPLEDKWRAFGWGVRRTDGHDLEQILDVVREAEAEPAKPQVIIAVTVKGKGISYMENSVPWHSHPIDDEQLRLALQELDEAAKEMVAP